MKATICKYFLYTILGASLSYNAYATSPQNRLQNKRGWLQLIRKVPKLRWAFWLLTNWKDGKPDGKAAVLQEIISLLFCNRWA